jgi:hypothetical protein
MLFITLYRLGRLFCFCIRAGYISCITRLQDPNHGRVDSSDVENLLDLEYPPDKKSMSLSELWSRWRNHVSTGRNVGYTCSASYFARPVDITEHILDGKEFLQMTSRLTFEF